VLRSETCVRIVQLNYSERFSLPYSCVEYNKFWTVFYNSVSIQLWTVHIICVSLCRRFYN